MTMEKISHPKVEERKIHSSNNNRLKQSNHMLNLDNFFWGFPVQIRVWIKGSTS